MSAEQLEHLSDAPIDEVSCGVVFTPIEELDPLVVGSYWSRRVAEYPRHGLRIPHPIIAAQLAGASPPVRSVMISNDDQFVIQVQTDRFIVNWRRRDAGYPRFNNRDGKEGVLGRALREYVAFDEFCKSTFGHALDVKGVELAKVDVIREGAYWSDLAQVAEVLPCLRDFIGFTKSSKPAFMLRFNEVRPQGVVQIGVTLGESRSESRVLTIETRIARELVSMSLETTFKEANVELNEAFAGLIPKEQRQKYFNAGRSNR